MVTVHEFDLCACTVHESGSWTVNELINALFMKSSWTEFMNYSSKSSTSLWGNVVGHELMIPAGSDLNNAFCFINNC
jgi:hypothetical protein